LATTYVLHGETGSGSFSSEAALILAGAEYRVVELDFSVEEQRGAKHLRLNPSGKVPALELPSGEIVTESAAILLTIAERHPDAKLLPPSASDERARALRWILFLAGEIYPMVEIVDYPGRFATANTEALREAARARIRERFRSVEAAIHGPWLLPSGFSAADIYIANFGSFFLGGDWRRANCPKVEAIMQSVAKHPRLGALWQKHFGRDTD